MKKDTWVLGVSGDGNRFHDNSVCLVKNGEVVYASSEERYTRVKHDPRFPKNAIKAALKFAGVSKADISYFATGWPKLSVTKTFLNIDQAGLFVSGINYVKNSGIYGLLGLLNHLQRLSIKPVADYLPASKTICIDHYLAHASSAYRTSGFKDCLAVIWDGFGTTIEGRLVSGGVFECKGGMIKFLESHSLEDSLGLFYEAVTNALGYQPAEGEGKTMGLAAYGKPTRFLKEGERFAPRFNNGKWVHSKYWFDALSSVDLKYKEIFDSTYMGSRLKKLIKKSPQDTAAACQYIIEKEAVKFFEYLYKKYKYKKYAAAGGVFLNVKMGKKLRELPFVESYYIHPHASDGGLALGAALEVYSEKVKPVTYRMKDAYLGDEFSDSEIKKQLDKTKGITYEAKSNLPNYVAKQISEGVVVGWFQGRAEWGPRALGARSVLADPRKPEIKDRINNYLKKREWFMPFAPSVLEERASLLFKNASPCSFMTMAYDVTAFGRKSIEAAIHVDSTCRPQTVNKKTNPLYWKVISEFEKITGVPAILNTSFNRHGLPIVNSPHDAIEHLLWGSIDELAIGKFIVKRN